ncbi:MAG: SMP-30/gluconolactonase/LRE family protein [Acidimicrobiales bacterium]
MSSSTTADDGAGSPRRTEPLIEGLHFGECPRWHDGRLWYVDFYAGTVLSAALRPGPAGTLTAAGIRTEVEVPGEPAGIGWLPDGRLLVVARKPRKVLRLEHGRTLVEHGDLSPWAGFYGNDMVVDDTGRAYVGNFGFDLDRAIEEKGISALLEPPGPPTTTLVRIDPDGSAHPAAEELSFPNGTVITPDGSTLIVAETLAGRLTAFDIGADGALGGRRVWAELELCAPDGICIDEQGRIWVANAVAPECRLVAEGGEIVDRVETSQNCFACMLGGEDRKTLFMVTGKTSTESVVSVTRDGRIEQARVEVSGGGRP